MASRSDSETSFDLFDDSDQEVKSPTVTYNNKPNLKKNTSKHQSRVTFDERNGVELAESYKMRHREPSEFPTFACPYCDISHELKPNLAEHIVNVHGSDMEHEDLQELIRGLDLLLCPMCRYTCSSEHGMQRHVEIQHMTPGSSVASGSSSPLEDVVATSTSAVTICPMCGLEESDPDLLNSHVEFHFETSGTNQDPSLPSSSSVRHTAIKQSSSATSSSSSSSTSSRPSHSFKGKRKQNGYHYKHQYRQNLERSVMKGKITAGEYYDQLARMKEKDSRGMDDGHSRVQGLIEKLAYFYRSNILDKQRVALCHPTDFYCSSYGDKGWGCGYRNFQMMVSSLSRIEMYSTKFANDQSKEIEVPSIPKIQTMIEAAWRDGFDTEGSQQLDGRLVNTRKWIGATEIVATLSSMGIRCQLVEFPVASGPDGTHPHMLQWVRDYFHQGHGSKPPLYLQHQGHSRTIVGVEEDRGTIRLLLFDPSASVDHIHSLRYEMYSFSWKQLGTFRRNLPAFKSKQYQIVAAIGVMNGDDIQTSKKLTSIRIT